MVGDSDTGAFLAMGWWPTQKHLKKLSLKDSPTDGPNNKDNKDFNRNQYSHIDATE